MKNDTTAEVNFHSYPAEQYDRDIRNSIPFHDEIHQTITDFIWDKRDSQPALKVLDLGCGTGLTSQAIRLGAPNSRIILVDFSQHMLNGARRKLGDDNATYRCEDYTKMNIAEKRFDVIASVIGLHHQSDVHKAAMFAKIRRGLADGGTFVFGDLVTFRDPEKAALEAARHYHHLVENAADEETLAEWAHHHMFLNRLAPLEDQIEWLKAAGFSAISTAFIEYQTALIIAR